MEQPNKPAFLTTAFVGGFVILMPLLLALFLLKHGIDLVEGPAGRLAAILPLFNRLGPLGDLLVAILMLVFIAFFAGVLAMGGPGRRLSHRLRTGPLASIPPFSFINAMLASFLADEEKVSVVLVPSDQGQTLAFVFGPIVGDPVCVYVPSAPNWRSGSISFARRADIEETGLTFTEATRTIMMLGRARASIADKLQATAWFRDENVPRAAAAVLPEAAASRPFHPQ